MQNLWDAAKAVLRGKFIAMRVFLKKQEKISNKQPYCLLELEREKQTKHKVSRRKEIIQIREEINKIEMIKKNNRQMSTKPRAASLKG